MKEKFEKAEIDIQSIFAGILAVVAIIAIIFEMVLFCL